MGLELGLLVPPFAQPCSTNAPISHVHRDQGGLGTTYSSSLTCAGNVQRREVAQHPPPRAGTFECGGAGDAHCGAGGAPLKRETSSKPTSNNVRERKASPCPSGGTLSTLESYPQITFKKFCSRLTKADWHYSEGGSFASGSWSRGCGWGTYM